jgi:MFS family permease
VTGTAAGLIVFALGSTAAAFASGTGMLIGARVVMGLGAAFVMPATLSILNAVFPPKERPQAIAAWSAVTGVGIVIGPTLVGRVCCVISEKNCLPRPSGPRSIHVRAMLTGKRSKS